MTAHSLVARVAGLACAAAALGAAPALAETAIPNEAPTVELPIVTLHEDGTVTAVGQPLTEPEKPFFDPALLGEPPTVELPIATLHEDGTVTAVGQPLTEPEKPYFDPALLGEPPAAADGLGVDGSTEGAHRVTIIPADAPSFELPIATIHEDGTITAVGQPLTEPEKPFFDPSQLS